MVNESVVDLMRIELTKKRLRYHVRNNLRLYLVLNATMVSGSIDKKLYHALRDRVANYTPPGKSTCDVCGVLCQHACYFLEDASAPPPPPRRIVLKSGKQQIQALADVWAQLTGEDNNTGFYFCQNCAVNKQNVVPRMGGDNVVEITVPKEDLYFGCCAECATWTSLLVPWVFPEFHCCNVNKECVYSD